MLNQYNNLEAQEQEFTELLVRFSEEDREEIKGAYELAKEMHTGQLRHEGTAYVIHPLRVAMILMRDSGIEDKELIIAALLHDTVEDTPVTLEDLSKKYTQRTVGLVEDLTRHRPESETEQQKKQAKPIKLNWFIKNASKDSKLIKCADILDNMRTWEFIPEGHWGEKKFSRWMDEAQNLYIPLAEVTDEYFVKEIRDLYEKYKLNERFKLSSRAE